MFLKSQGFASNLSSPDGEHTLEAFCKAAGRPYKSYGLPVSLDTFNAYGQWFRQELVPDIEETLVTSVVPKDGHFEISLANGEQAQAASVVVAVGVEHFARVPAVLAGLPASACTHVSAHDDLGVFAGQKVVVLGAGQSALESAALLHENGADVQLVARTQQLKWNGAPLPPDRALLQRLREPESGLGSGWSTWFYSRQGERAVSDLARPGAEVREGRRRGRGAGAQRARRSHRSRRRSRDRRHRIPPRRAPPDVPQ
jgi:hypothetical protein